MVNEELVLKHIGHACKLSRAFRWRDPDEAKSVALFALVKSATRYTGPPDNGAQFWGYARKAVWGALVDKFGRPQPEALEDFPHPTYNPWAAIEARMSIEAMATVLSRKQRRAIAADLLGAPWCPDKTNAIATMRREFA